jgi:hypothetical protein
LAQAACRSARLCCRAASESDSGALREVQVVWAQRPAVLLARAAASHREHRAWPVARWVHAGLRRAVRARAQPSALAAEQAVVADAESRRDAVRDVHRREVSAAQARRVAELAAQDRGVGERHEEALAVARDGLPEPAVRRGDAEVRLLAPEEAQPLEALAVQPSVAQEARLSVRHAAALLAAACLPGPSADRAPPAPSKTMTQVQHGQIAKRKTRRSRAIPISASSCPSLVLVSCLSKESTTHPLAMCHARNGLTMVRRECGSVHRRFDYFA